MLNEIECLFDILYVCLFSHFIRGKVQISHLKKKTKEQKFQRYKETSNNMYKTLYSLREYKGAVCEIEPPQIAHVHLQDVCSRSFDLESILCVQTSDRRL